MVGIPSGLKFPTSETTVNLLRTFRFVGSALMLWMIGKENLPSVKSSANPLLVAYTAD